VSAACCSLSESCRMASAVFAESLERPLEPRLACLHAHGPSFCSAPAAFAPLGPAALPFPTFSAPIRPSDSLAHAASLCDAPPVFP
jgi:hypothetical protein